MKKTILLCVCIVAGLSVAMAQTTIVVQNGAKTELYSTLEAAVTAAAAGDTLYIPGGTFAAPATIDKTLHWVGVGHYPAGTVATLPTKLTGNIAFTGNCDNSSMEGIYFTGSMTLGSAADEATGITIKRCRIYQDLALRTIDTGNPDLNFNMTETVLNYYVYGKNGRNCTFKNNLFFNKISAFKDSYFAFNAFSNRSQNLIDKMSNSIFVNNVIMGMLNSIQIITCSFENNLLGSLLNIASSNFLKDNITNVGYNNIFVNASSSFKYAYNYHLKSDSQGIGAATDGTNIGIYGSSTPYKEHAVPFYPHVTNVDIDTEVNATNNTLGVKITVEGQSR